MKEIAYSWVIAVAINHFVFEMTGVVLQFALNIRKLRVKLVIFAAFCRMKIVVLAEVFFNISNSQKNVGSLKRQD